MSTFRKTLFGYATKGSKREDKHALRVYVHMDPASNTTNNVCYNWHPDRIISEGLCSDEGFACLVLNRRINIPSQLVIKLWQNAYIRCTVDGGTNRWHYFLNAHCQGSDLKPPDFITGDFDSVTEENLEYFSDPITRKVHTPDQNHTDFTKAIGIIKPIMVEQKLNDIIVFHDTSGRFDQIMANVNTLFKMSMTNLNIYLLSGNSLSYLLRPGKHSIYIPKVLVEEQRWCALIPIGEPAYNVTTTGLKWNLRNSTLKFGGMVSTSNTYASEYVEIETDSCLIWSMGVFCFEDDE